MFLLLSPAKNLNEKDHAPITRHRKPALIEQSADIASVLKKYDVVDIQELMGVSAKIAQTNVMRHLAWQVDFDDSAKPALYLFDGDAYKGLDAYHLSDEAVSYLDKRLGILSGLYGLVRPLDDIMPYRLEMGTKLAVGRHQDLYDFWGHRVSDLINQRLAEIESRTVINLASQEYFKVVHPKLLNARIITPRFLDYKNGTYKVISFYAKRARGLMARYCAMHQLEQIEALKAFDLEGYYFDKHQSTDDDWVFLRD